MTRRKKDDPKDWDRSLFPKKIIKDGNVFITDGYIGTTKVIILKQPSIETIEKFNSFLAKKAIELENEKAKEIIQCK